MEKTLSEQQFLLCQITPNPAYFQDEIPRFQGKNDREKSKGEKLLSERFEQELDGVLHCYDRIVITGSLQPWCYAQGMTHYLYEQGIRIFDYAGFAEPLRYYSGR